MYSAYHQQKKAEAAAAFLAILNKDGCSADIPPDFHSKLNIEIICRCGGTRTTSLDKMRKTQSALCSTCSALAIKEAPHILAIKQRTIDLLTEKATVCSATNLVVDYFKPTPEQVSFTCQCGTLVKTSIESAKNKKVLLRCQSCKAAASSEGLLQHPLTVQAKAKSLQRLIDNATAAGTHILPETFDGLAKHVTYICTHCKQPKQSIANAMLKPGNRFLCLDCQTGEMSSKWNPNRSEEDRVLGRSRYAWWPRAVLEAHDFTCVISGIRGQELAAHHLYNYGHHPHLRHLVCNGVALSRELHDEFHNLYGRGNNTLEQFQSFYFSKTGREYSNAELSRSLIVRPINPYEVA